MNTNPPCPFCKAQESVKNGSNPSGTKRFLCNRCGCTYSQGGLKQGRPYTFKGRTPPHHYDLLKAKYQVQNIEKLVGTPFIWGKTDCYWLANEARRILVPELEPLPDYSQTYTEYTEKTLPVFYIAYQFRSSSRAVAIEPGFQSAGDIVLMHGEYGVAIGTVLRDCESILGFEYQFVSKEIRLGSDKPIGYWRVT